MTNAISPLIDLDEPQVIDEAIPVDLFETLLDVCDGVGWRYGWSFDNQPNIQYWHHEVGYGLMSNREDITANLTQYPSDVFLRYDKWLRSWLVPQNSSLLRCYLNAHTFGTDGAPHTDSDRPDDLTVVAYMAREWRSEWAGETVVFDHDGDIALSAMPKPRRLMIFPGNRIHGPRPVSALFRGLRIVLVMKYALNRSEGKRT